jgi:hypothetical protein
VPPARAAPEWDLLLYVKSLPVVLKVLGYEDRNRAFAPHIAAGFYANRGGPLVSRETGRFDGKPVTSLELPESESDAIHRVWDLARARNRSLHIVDVGKESEFRRFFDEHRHHLTKFPILVRRDGERLEGADQFTPENLERFLAG